MLDDDGFSPLHWAAFNGFESCIDVLMQTETDSLGDNLKDNVITSYLNDITMASSTESLTNKVKRANLIGQYFAPGCTTPLHCSASQENVSCTEMLIEKFGESILLVPDSKER